MDAQFGALALVLTLMVGTQAAIAAPAGPTAGSGVSPAPRSATPSGGRPSPPGGPGPESSSSSHGSDAAPPPQVSQDAPARSRMHECGHQWSTMKKAGTVGTLTWKEFSATCLVVSK